MVHISSSLRSILYANIENIKLKSEAANKELELRNIQLENQNLRSEAASKEQELRKIQHEYNNRAQELNNLYHEYNKLRSEKEIKSLKQTSSSKSSNDNQTLEKPISGLKAKCELLEKTLEIVQEENKCNKDIIELLLHTKGKTKKEMEEAFSQDVWIIPKLSGWTFRTHCFDVLAANRQVKGSPGGDAVAAPTTSLIPIFINTNNINYITFNLSIYISIASLPSEILISR
ncbi:hypothetical protein C1645_833422 [Glomus cerebriforme]|uniref:Uncharacterized protein n=1 Tax=Glomus cerebriforme TaxID=658196 RepID=A0A397SHP6_9GLOM|nr:hypothetical protein C1645_833422 [Glomus cerebriforme]